MQPDPDLELLNAWRAGDHVAGNALLQKYFGSLRRFFANKVAYDDAEDLIQQTMLHCLQGEQYSPKAVTFKGFLFGIARRALFEHYRRRARQQVFDPPVESSVESIEDSALLPTVFYEQKHRNELMLQALRAIPLDDQLLLELRYWQDLTGSEVAEVLGISKHVAMARLARARRKLVSVLERLEGEGAVQVATKDSEFEVWAAAVGQLNEERGKGRPHLEADSVANEPHFALPVPFISEVVLTFACVVEEFSRARFWASVNDMDITSLGEIFIDRIEAGSTKVWLRGSSGVLAELVAKVQSSASDLRRFVDGLSLVAVEWRVGDKSYRFRVESDGASPYLVWSGDAPGSRRYLVALTYPRTCGHYVREVDYFLSRLMDQNQIFFDQRYEAELARPNLDTYLQSIYHKESELVVPFLGLDYKDSEWCGLEWRAVRHLIKSRRDSEIMFVRLDDVVIEGVYSIDGCIDARKRTPAQCAKLIHSRLEHNRKHG